MIEDVAEVARWAKGIEGVHECIAGRLRRAEPRRRAGLPAGAAQCRGTQERLATGGAALRLGSGGDATPYGVQHLLSTCVWDADLVGDDLSGTTWWSIRATSMEFWWWTRRDF